LIASVLNHTDTIDSSVIEASESGDSKKAMANAVSSASDNERAIAIAIVIASSIDGVLETVLERNTAILGALDKAIMLTTDPALRRSLQALQTQLPNPQTDSTALQNWWRSAGSDWINQLVEAQTRFRDLVYEKPFSPAQMAQLDQYYSANLLLVNCLNSDCNVSPAVRSAIEATLLCPILEQ
jgi:hypothetical protein